MLNVHPTRPPGQGGKRADVRRPPIPDRTSPTDRPARAPRAAGILGGYVRVSSAFLDYREEPLTALEKLLLLQIEAHAWGTCYAFPGDKELAGRAHCSQRQVRRLV